MSDEEKRWPFDGFYLKLAEAQREYEQEQHIDPASLTEEERQQKLQEILDCINASRKKKKEADEQLDPIVPEEEPETAGATPQPAKQYITDLVGEDYKNWHGIVVLDAGTNSGKTYFILKTLLPWAYERRKRILILCNREALRNQIERDVNRLGSIEVSYEDYDPAHGGIVNKPAIDNKYEHTIRVETYQWLETFLQRNEDAHSSKAGAIARVADIGIKNCCVYNPHGWAFNMRCSAKKKAMYTAIEKIAAPFCDKIICISEAEKQSALDKKICRKEKLQVIFNGVDIEAYENGVHGTVKRGDLNIPENAFVVGMVGRISPQKAPDVFVKMAKQVKEKVPNAHFIIVGNGDQESDIRKYAADNGFSDSLHITGWVDNPMSYVELFDVACLLSRWEGFGLALPEYMMAGKPIVASSVDAIPNIIRDGENGLLVEVDDDIGASEAVLRLYREDELRNRLVAQGMEDVHNRFNARRVSEEHGKLFERM